MCGSLRSKRANLDADRGIDGSVRIASATNAHRTRARDLLEADGPADPAGDELLVLGSLPEIGPMAQRGVEDTSFAVSARPGQREVAVRALHTLFFEVHRAGVERQQYVSLRAIPVSELIDLVVQCPHCGQPV